MAQFSRPALLAPFMLTTILSIAGCSSEGGGVSVERVPVQPPPSTPPPDEDPQELLPRAWVVPALLPPVQEGMQPHGHDQQPAFQEQTRAPGMETDIPLVVEAIAGIEFPWGMTFLSVSELLITSKAGALYYVQLNENGGQSVVQTVTGLPAIAQPNSPPNLISVGGQGGLLDVTIGENFGQDRYVYFTFVETGETDRYSYSIGKGTSVARARLSEDNDHLSEWTVLLRQAPQPSAGTHFGPRLAWDQSGYLYATTGDLGQDSAEGPVQSLDNLIGKILRIQIDGEPPASNSFVTADGRDEIWSYGHRNVQGAAIDPYTGALWTTEHGNSGGDELNKPQAGLNYGWPLIGYGNGVPGSADYMNQTWSQGMEQPIYYWDPSVAPSGMTFYYGTMFPEWNGQILVASLRGGLIRLMLKDEKVVGEQIHFATTLGRTRDVEIGPDGAIYVLLEGNGSGLVRISRGPD